MKIVVSADSVCNGCKHLNNNKCEDSINKGGYARKDKYNNDLDTKILEICGIPNGLVTTPLEICYRYITKYLDNMEEIYKLNSKENTRERKEGVLAGLKNYGEMHNISF